MQKLNDFLRPQIASRRDFDTLPYANLLDWLAKYPADTEWLLTLLAIFNEDDEIFQKGYRFVREKKSATVVKLNNSDGLYDNLPPRTEKEIRSSNRLRLSKALRNEIALAKLEARKQELAEYEERLRLRIAT